MRGEYGRRNIGESVKENTQIALAIGVSVLAGAAVFTVETTANVYRKLRTEQANQESFDHSVSQPLTAADSGVPILASSRLQESSPEPEAIVQPHEVAVTDQEGTQ